MVITDVIPVSVGSVSRNIFFELNFSEASVREDRRFILFD